MTDASANVQTARNRLVSLSVFLVVQPTYHRETVVMVAAMMQDPLRHLGDVSDEPFAGLRHACAALCRATDDVHAARLPVAKVQTALLRLFAARIERGL